MSTRHSLRTVVHREGIAAADRFGLLFFNHGRKEVVLRANPNAWEIIERAHPVPVARVRLPDFTQRIRTA